MGRRFLGLLAIATSLGLRACSSADGAGTREVRQPNRFRIEIPEEWDIQLAPPAWLLARDPFNVTEFLDRRMQVSASGGDAGVGVALLRDPEQPIDLRRQVELQREEARRTEFAPEGVTERSAGDLTFLEFTATSTESPTEGSRTRFAYVQSTDRPNEAWLILCYADGEANLDDCAPIIDSFEVETLDLE